MIKDILFLIVGAIAVIIFISIRQWIINCIKKEVGLPINNNTFSCTKLFKGLFGFTNSIDWAKDLVQLFNIRKLFIYSIIISLIFGYGWWKGRGNTPIAFDLKGKEAHIQLNEHWLHITKDGSTYVEDEKGRILKQIKVKDIPELERALRPYGFILEPIFVGGYGISSEKNQGEIGVGVSLIKYYKWKLETFLTNYGLYAGTSYNITDNSGAGIGAGKGYSGENKVILYYKFKF